jgi:hypothetical protein
MMVASNRMKNRTRGYRIMRLQNSKRELLVSLCGQSNTSSLRTSQRSKSPDSRVCAVVAVVCKAVS